MRAAIQTLDELRLDPLFERLKPNLEHTSGGQLWLGLSGGVDSVVLLYLAVSCGLIPKVVYIHHGLSLSSDRWLNLAKSHAERLNLDFYSTQLNLKKASENQARDARYLAFSERMSQHDTLMLAHHADDQFETQLMRLCRGTSVHGLVGLNRLKLRQIQSKAVWLWRPLLDAPKVELYRVAEKLNLEFAEDPTNHETETTANLRSYLRAHVTPLLAARFSELSKSSSRLSELATESSQILSEVCSQDTQLCQITPSTFGVESLQSLSAARRRAVLTEILSHNQQRASRDKVLELESLVLNPPSSGLAVWHFAQVDYRFYQGVLHCLTSYPAKASSSNIKPLATASHPTLLLATRCWQVRSDLTQFGLATELLRAELHIEPAQTTDRLTLVEAVGSKPVKKLLQQLEVEPWLRSCCQVLLYQKQALALITPSDFYLCQSDYTQESGWVLAPEPKQSQKSS